MLPVGLPRFFGAATVFAGVLGAGAASALTIDTLETIGVDGTAVTSRTIDGVNVGITTGNGSSLLAATYNTAPCSFNGAANFCNRPLIPGNVSGTRFLGSNDILSTLGSITFSFTNMNVTSFGLTTLDLLETTGGEVTAASSVTLTAYLLGAVVDTHTITGPQGQSGVDRDFLVSDALGFDSAVLTMSGFSGTSGFGIDDLVLETASAVPAPAALPLFASGVGLLGLFGRFRRRRAAAE